MVSLADKTNVEFKNIALILKELKKVSKKPKKQLAELAGIALFLQNIYNGIENILKQVLFSKSIPLPKTKSWHRDLLDLAVENKIISNDLKTTISEYLAFRHFVMHSYSFVLNEEYLKPLIENIPNTCLKFKKEIKRFIRNKKVTQ